MDDISNLIKEARPLYFARKKRNNRIKTALCSLVIIVMAGMFYPRNNDYIYDYNYYLFGTDFSWNETTSIIEEMGLPTDDYGLLMVG